MSHARACVSAGVKTMRVTTGGSASEINASSSISESSRAESDSSFIDGLRASLIYRWPVDHLWISRCERMAVPVFVNEIFRGHFSERAKPLRTPRRHPDE